MNELEYVINLALLLKSMQGANQSNVLADQLLL